MYTAESPEGAHTGATLVPRDTWAFADCATTPFPGSPDPTRVCLRDGFDATKLYELAYTAKDPLVLGIGLAATRDIVSFFHFAEKDAAGTPNPVAGRIRHVVAIGDSQSGNFIRTFVHLGFNEDLSHRIVWDGAFPRIAARQTPINLRFGLPGGAAGLYEPGSDGVVWWGRYEDDVRGRPAASLLDRCTATRTCPKIVEAFGSAEFWGLRMSPDLIGTDARHDIPLPANVRRYYYPGTTHGGGRGGFRVDAQAGTQPGCSLPANPNPELDTTRALTRALVEWVTSDTPPPPSRYPRLAAGELVPVQQGFAAFPHLPGLVAGDSPLNPLLEYDFGTDLRLNDLTGTIVRMPPRILRTLPTFVPTVDADGNETAGVRSVLLQAPLGTVPRVESDGGGVLRGTRMWIRRRLHPVPQDARRAGSGERSTHFDRGALRHDRRLRMRRRARGPSGGRRSLSVPGRCRSPCDGSPDERRPAHRRFEQRGWPIDRPESLRPLTRSQAERRLTATAAARASPARARRRHLRCHSTSTA